MARDFGCTPKEISKGKLGILCALSMIALLILSMAACKMFAPSEKTEATPPASTASAPQPTSPAPPAPPPVSQPPATPPPAMVKPPAAEEPKPSPAPPSETPQPTAPPKEEAKPEVPAPPPVVYVETLKNANVRTGPSLKNKTIMILKKGVKAEKIGESGDWVQVKLRSGKTGWIFKELLKISE